MFYIALGMLFFVPMHYIAKSKGYKPARFTVPAIILCAACIVIPGLGLGILVIPLTFLGLVSLLKTRAGAPGEAWLKITFTCPACKETIVFDREREGLADLCPKCGEIVTVPE
jgi:hypothetical protein